MSGLGRLLDDDETDTSSWGSPNLYFLPDSIVDYTLSDDFKSDLFHTQAISDNPNSSKNPPVTLGSTTAPAPLTPSTPPSENIWSYSATATRFKQLQSPTPPSPDPTPVTENDFKPTLNSTDEDSESPFYNASSPIANTESPLTATLESVEEESSMLETTPPPAPPITPPDPRYAVTKVTRCDVDGSDASYIYTFGPHIHIPTPHTSPSNSPAHNTPVTSPRGNNVPPTLYHQDNIRFLFPNPTWRINPNASGYFDPSSHTTYMRPTSIPTPSLVPVVAPPPTSASLPALKSSPPIYYLNGNRARADGMSGLNIAAQFSNPPIALPTGPPVIVDSPKLAFPSNQFDRVQPSLQPNQPPSQPLLAQSIHKSFILNPSPSSTHPRSFTETRAPPGKGPLTPQHVFTPATPSMLNGKNPLLSKPIAHRGTSAAAYPSLQQQQPSPPLAPAAQTDTITQTPNDKNYEKANKSTATTQPTSQEAVMPPPRPPRTPLISNTPPTPAGGALLPSSSAQYPVWPPTWNYNTATPNPYSPQLATPNPQYPHQPPIPYTTYKKGNGRRGERVRSITTGQIKDAVSMRTGGGPRTGSRSYVTLLPSSNDSSLDVSHPPAPTPVNPNLLQVLPKQFQGKPQKDLRTPIIATPPHQHPPVINTPAVAAVPQTESPAKNQSKKFDKTNVPSTPQQVLDTKDRAVGTTRVNQNRPLPTPPVSRRTTTYTTTITTTITTIIPDSSQPDTPQEFSTNSKPPYLSLPQHQPLVKGNLEMANNEDRIVIIEEKTETSNNGTLTEKEGNRPRRGAVGSAGRVIMSPVGSSVVSGTGQKVKANLSKSFW